jgi:cell division protein FtsX
MSDSLLMPLAVTTGVVVIVVAIAVVLVVLFVTLSMRGRQTRGAKQRGENRQELADAHERAERAERDRDIAQKQAQQRIDPDH